jgi:acylphosphatase
MIHHETIVVSGKVQGVFFRASAKEQAQQLGINGLVKNLPDGRVHIEVEGSPEHIDTFRMWCATGPPRAVVEKVESQSGELCNYTSFKVIR